ncbi:MAG: acyl carrier protein [Verrucomicrobiae bacterium]|nr:acyl carrier protein [Verrucomicrobiae bacterium]
MTEDMLLEAVREVLGRYTEVPGHQIHAGLSFEDLGIDSLTAVGVVADLEEKLGITIPNDEALEVRSVGDVLERLGRHLGLEGGEAGGTVTAG